MNNSTFPDIAAMNEHELCAYFEPLMKPAVIAVVGASASGSNRANLFIDKLRDFDYPGKIYPVHVRAAEVEGMQAYPTLGDIPELVDYAYFAIPAKAVPGAIAAARGNLKFAHISSSGFAEVEGGEVLQEELLQAAREAGVRLLGPNCNGGYSPEGRFTMAHGASEEIGDIAIISQSGGMSVDFLRRGGAQGLRYRSIMALGNSADIGPSDLLEFHLADPKTSVIGFYLESVADGRRFFETLKRAEGKKPVVLLKGGQTQDGSRAVGSHTGTLAGENAAWDALCKQTGMILATTLDEFLNILLAFQVFEPHGARVTESIVMLGNGGGASVLGVDAFSRRGLRVPALSDDTCQALTNLNLAAGAGTTNPIDVSRAALTQHDSQAVENIIDIVMRHEPLDAFVLHVNMPVILTQGQGVDDVEKIVAAAERGLAQHKNLAHFALVLRSDGTEEIDAVKRKHRSRALKSGMAVFDETVNAATALAAVSSYERFLNRS